MINPSFIRIKNVSRKFGSITAVDDVSINIKQGEFFCLLGGSGSGKSTLLRMIAGFETPTSGRIEIDGEDMAGVPAYNRPTNMMFQSYALFPHMSVERNVAYGLQRDGVSKKDIRTRVLDMLALVKLEDYGARKPHQLSGGQRQRVALARALIKRPKVLLLDEPLGALDKKLREDTQFELSNIQEELGITFLLVTHDQEEAMSLSTRIGVMHHGRIVQVGGPKDVYEYPNSEFVANFIGSMNIFEGVVSDLSDQSATIHLPDLNASFDVAKGANTHVGHRRLYALRPEKIAISHQVPADGLNSLEGKVEEISYLGGQSVYLVRFHNGQTIRVLQTNRIRGDNQPITWDDMVHLSWAPASAVVLEA